MISNLLFEALWFPAVLAGVGFAAMLVLGQRMERQRRGKYWLLWMLAVVGLFLLNKLVVTDGEQLRIQFDRLVDAVAKKNLPVIHAIIAPDCAAPDMDGRQLHDWIDAQLKVVEAYDASIGRWDLSLDGDRATVDIRAAATVTYGGMPMGRIRSAWQLDWRRGSEGWKVTGLTAQSIEERTIRALRELRP